MSEPPETTPVTAEQTAEPADPDALIVAVDGYSGPLDVLLTDRKSTRLNSSHYS